MKHFIALIAALVVSGCVSAVGTKKHPDGSVESITVKGFLANVSGGNYVSTNRDGTVTTLSIQNATPDQQSIAVLAGGVVDLAKLFMLARQTNNVGTNSP
jgi:hypothetical protein